MITRRGWALVGSAIGLFAAGRILGLVQLAVLALAALLTLLVAIVWVRANTPRLRARREVKERLQVGVQGRVDVVVEAGAPPVSCSRHCMPARKRARPIDSRPTGAAASRSARSARR